MYIHSCARETLATSLTSIPRFCDVATATATSENDADAVDEDIDDER
jgi:hypothetical protein